MGLLDGEVVVFTGAGAGIGRSVVHRYVAEGARVVAVDISASVSDLAAELGSSVLPLVADVATWAGARSAVDLAVREWGKLDLLVANAGITDGARPLEEIDGEQLPAAFAELFGVNVLGPLLGVRAALDELTATRGSVIITGSYASTNAGGGGVLYTSSKHAVHGIIRQLAYELAPDIRVNGVAPGVAPTRLRGTRSLGQQPQDSVLDGTERALPLQEVPTVSAFDGVFTMLASREQSGAMTGSLVTVDSGLSIRGIAKPGGRVKRQAN